MTLRIKTLSFIGTATILVIVLLSSFYNTIIFESYKNLEEISAKDNTERVLNSLSQEIHDLNVLMTGYSEWDDTYKFIQTVHTGDVEETPYIHSNYTDTMFLANKLNMVMLLNLDGKVIYKKGFNLSDEKFVEPPKEILSDISSNNSLLLQHDSPTDDKIGILMLKQVPMLIVSQPILKNDGSGPARGTLIAGRFLDKVEIERLSSLTKTNLSFAAYNELNVPPSIQPEILDKINKDDIWVKSTDTHTIVGSAILNDIYNKPVLILQIAKDRTISQQGLKSIMYLVVSLIIAGVTFALITLFFIHRFILSRLVKLISDIKAISIEHDFSGRVEVKGDDEISELEREFNSMMDSLETSQLLIKKQVNLDPLTQLPNRNVFYEQLKKSLETIQQTDKKLAVLFIDLDRFKNVNDQFGHDIGDELIQLTAKRLKSCIRESDLISRLGGDEFTILLNDLTSSEDVNIVMDRIFKKLGRPFHIKNRRVFVTASIGVSIYPIDGEDPETLVRKADLAMFRVKETGRNHYMGFTNEINEAAARKIRLEQDLLYALERNELYIKYQPKMSLLTGKITGVEALLRWRHETLGEISPVEFIPIAEASGTIISIGEWVLQSACKQMKKWQEKNYPHFHLAINLSSVQIEQDEFIAVIKNVLKEFELAPDVLELEITESMMMKDVEISAKKLEVLKKLGIKISMDDFGTGYSSLSYLKRLPLDYVKIDKSFVSNLGNTGNDTSIIKAIIDLGHNLELKVVAEGVETIEQLTILHEQHCDEIQGYYVEKPLYPFEFEKFLESFSPPLEYLAAKQS